MKVHNKKEINLLHKAHVFHCNRLFEARYPPQELLFPSDMVKQIRDEIAQNSIKLKTLYDGTQVPATINIDERIFQVFTYDGEIILCNLATAQMLLPQCEILKHYWNGRLEVFDKRELKIMYL